jgi:ferrous iron transport protein A
MAGITLAELKPGQRGTVVRVGGIGAVRRRMLDMGLTAGTEVTAVRRAPLGDPIEFTVRGYNLSLRQNEAQSIQIELLLEGQG